MPLGFGAFNPEGMDENRPMLQLWGKRRTRQLGHVSKGRLTLWIFQTGSCFCARDQILCRAIWEIMMPP
jgi:hypothetical protein